jgi:hypothetical protein
MSYIKKKNFEFFLFLTKYFLKKHKFESKINKLKIWLLNYLNRYSKKNIEINLIRLKYIYLNNSMLVELIARKLITKKRSLLKVKRKIFARVKLVRYNKYKPKDKINIFNIMGINSLRELSTLKSNNNYLYLELLSRIKYKFISGIRLIAAGRLTKRNIAARAVKAMTYKGNLKNIDSSHRSMSIPAMRGDWRPNLEFTVVHNTTKTGSFGIKGWISYYGYSTSSKPQTCNVLDPLITKNLADYLLFKQAFEIIKSKKHLTFEGINEVDEIKNSMNKSRVIIENTEIKKKIKSSLFSVKKGYHTLINPSNGLNIIFILFNINNIRSFNYNTLGIINSLSNKRSYHSLTRSLNSSNLFNKINIISYNNYSTLSNRNSSKNTSSAQTNNKNILLKYLKITLKLILSIIIIFYVQNLIIPLLRPNLDNLLAFVSNFHNVSFLQTIINITKSNLFDWAFYFFSFLGAYNMIDYLSIHLEKIIKNIFYQKLNLTGINENKELNKNSKLFINFMENSNEQDPEVRASNTGNANPSFWDTVLNRPNNSQNENSDERVSNKSTTQNIEADSSESNNNSRPKRRRINQSSKVLTELNKDQSEDNRPLRRKTRLSKHSQKVNSNTQKETASSGELFDSQQNNTNNQNNPDQREGTWQFFKQGFYKNEKGLKDYFEGGFVFFPKGSNTKNVFAGTYVNKNSPTVFTFLNPNESDGNWHYFKQDKYLDKTTGRKKFFEGGYVFLPSDCENGVWSAIQHSSKTPPYHVTDSSNADINEPSGVYGYQASKTSVYRGQEKIDYDIMKAQRVFENKTVFETMPKANNSIIETLKHIFGERFWEWNRLNARACGIPSKDNDLYNIRIHRYANEVIRHVKSLHELENKYKKGELAKLDYEEQKNKIIIYILDEERKLKYLKNVR